VIAIVDYGAGNISSVKKALEHVGAGVEVTSDSALMARAEKIVVPGVGHFSRCESLNTGLREAVLEAITAGKPFLGICVGMQWMFAGSTEAPQTPGARLFPGLCSRFPASVKSPHVGWNRLKLVRASRLMRGIEDGAFVYFTHSFRAPIVEETVASAFYGEAFSAAVERDNVFGVQFHPEKSAAAGLKILENFCAL
jgi:glutamine amidotransferase